MSDGSQLMSEQNNKVDYKTATISGAGGATLVGLLMAFQNQGVEMIQKNQAVQSQVFIERTNANAQMTTANSQRIDKVETTVQNLNNKIDNGFNSIRAQLRDETSKISEIIRISSSDRYTKSEQHSHEISINARLQRIEDEIKDIQKRRVK